MTTDQESKSASTLLDEVLLHLSNMVRGEIALAQAELTEKLRKTRNGLLMLALALALVPALTGLMFATLIIGLVALGLEPVWVALLVTCAIALVILALVMKARQLLRWGDLSSSRTVQGLRRDAQTLKEMVTHDASV